MVDHLLNTEHYLHIALTRFDGGVSSSAISAPEMWMHPNKTSFIKMWTVQWDSYTSKWTEPPFQWAC